MYFPPSHQPGGLVIHLSTDSMGCDGVLRVGVVGGKRRYFIGVGVRWGWGVLVPGFLAPGSLAYICTTENIRFHQIKYSVKK